MLVEDDADTLELLMKVLEDGGYPVVTAADGQQAINLLEQGIRPCIVIVDLLLPHVSGGELLKFMQTDPLYRTIPTVVVSGLPRESIKVVADAVLLKPCEPQTVLDTVKRITGYR